MNFENRQKSKNVRYTINGKVKASAIVPGARRPVGEYDLALVPALVAFSDVGEVDAAETEALGLGVVDQVHAPVVAVTSWYWAVIPREHRSALKR